MFDFVTTIHVRAVRWDGENIQQMKWLLKGIVEDDLDGDPCVYRSHVESYFNNYSGKTHANPGYYVLQFEAWGDDQEVDPGCWVVVYADGEGEIMDDQQFDRMGFMEQ